MLRSAFWITTLLLVGATLSLPGGSAACHVDHANCDPSHQGAGRGGRGGGDPSPAPSCDASNLNYNPTQATHVFLAAEDAALTVDSQALGVAASVTYDTSGCATGDGDAETGTGGAQFPESSWGSPCALATGHHNGGPGATATVRSNTGNLAMDYFFGTDGQTAGVDVATSPCTGNNVVSDDYDTDPFDCGQGVTGHFPGSSATLAPNPNPHDGSTTDPDPWAPVYGAVPQGSSRSDPNGEDCLGVNDGSAWAFFIFGPEEAGLIQDPPLTEISGCPYPVGNGSSSGGGVAETGLLTGPLDGNKQCGVHGSVGIPTVGVSTPLQGTITSP